MYYKQFYKNDFLGRNMLHNLPTVTKLIKLLQQVPYLASKNLFRVTSYFLQMDQKHLQQFCTILQEANQQVLHCSVCFVWKERDRQCTFCDNHRRIQDLVCVVESWHDMLAIEKTGAYDGVYHVLTGVICPLDGIGPDDLTIEPLVARVVTHNVTEIILATNQTPEGEATATYIAKKIKDKNIKISCLARGIPVGSSLESIDRVTVYKAIAERRPF